MATTTSVIDRTDGSDAIRPSGALLANRYHLEGRQREAADRFAAVDRTTAERVFVKFERTASASSVRRSFSRGSIIPESFAARMPALPTAARSSSWNGSTATISRRCWLRPIAGWPMTS